MDFLTQNIDAILYGVGLFAALVLYVPFSPMLIDLVMLPRHVQIGIYRYRFWFWAVVWAATLVLLARSLGAVEQPTGLFAPLVGFGKMIFGDWAAALVGTGDPSWLMPLTITFLVMAMMFWSGYVPYVMTPPKNPKILSIDEADKLLKPDDMVLGVEEGGEARAYPRDWIARPHYFVDTVGGKALTVSYCILCNSGIAFHNQLNGKPLDLKCVTAYNNNIIYLDPKSGNFIQQLDGTVCEGPDKGAVLDAHPVVQARWADWKALHPDTKLYLAPAQGFRDKMVALMLQMMIPIHKLSKRNKPWHRVRGKVDNRLPAMAYVYAVELNGECATYAEADLQAKPVVNDQVGGRPIAVFYDPAHDIGDIFDPVVDGQTLSFTAQTGADGAIAQDQQTGSSWNVRGRAVAGPLQGCRLQAVPHFNKLFWFSWPLFKRQVDVRAA